MGKLIIGPNRVTSFISHCIENYINEEVKRLYIFCQNWAGKKKNNY